MSRLDATTPVPAGVGGPGERPERVGIVHLGIGAFHRAHQAVLTEDAARATGERGWGILGVTQRSPRVVGQLRPQDGLYGVLTLGPGETSLRVVGQVLDAAHPGTETPRVLHAIAAPTTHLVTVTVTEKGYVRRVDGTLDTDAVAADLEHAARELAAAPGARPVTDGAPDAAAHGVLDDAPPASTAVGLLVRGLVARYAAGGQAITVLSCDNVADNGHVLGALVRQAVDALAAAVPPDAGATGSAPSAEQVDALRRWLDASVTFPCSVVDRIVPATTPEHHEIAEALLGAEDAGLVAGEPFAQWVIEDRFAGPRPAWELAGARLVADVAPYEDAKLLFLNAAHSLLAYAGVLAGHATLAAAVADPRLVRHARALHAEARAALGDGPEGLDLVAYGEQVLARFANPATGHRTIQVASDGTLKIPLRWGPTAAGLARGAGFASDGPTGVAFGLAAWTAFVRRWAAGGPGAPALDDPRADELRATVASAGGGDEAVVRALLALPGLLPDGLGSDPALLAAVLAALPEVAALAA